MSKTDRIAELEQRVAELEGERDQWRDLYFEAARRPAVPVVIHPTYPQVPEWLPLPQWPRFTCGVTTTTDRILTS